MSYTVKCLAENISSWPVVCSSPLHSTVVNHSGCFFVDEKEEMSLVFFNWPYCWVCFCSVLNGMTEVFIAPVICVSLFAHEYDWCHINAGLF